MKTLLSFYTLKLPLYFVYMLQQVEYSPKKFIAWIGRLLHKNRTIQSVSHRQKLVFTNKTKALLAVSYGFMAGVMALLFLFTHEPRCLVVRLGLFLMLWPFILGVFLAVITYFAHVFIIKPQHRKLVAESQRLFAGHKGVKIAVIGSYGKTTMKELLNTVLSEGLKVASTPGNMNTSVSHTRFAIKLSGDEDVLIVEFGEGEPGDVARMSKALSPDYAVITGLAPNHLDLYSSVSAVADDLLAVYKYTDPSSVFVTKESGMLQQYLIESTQFFSTTGVMGWKINDIVMSTTGVAFIMRKSKKTINVSSGLLGRHQVAPLAFVAALADKFGLNVKQIETGLKKTVAFPHRMQPRNIHGAWLIDDTYNGNLEGAKAGLKMLTEIEAKRKWYITPGLVDQGSETTSVHVQLGQAIANCNPDIVVLMENSVRPIIEDSMKEHGFSGDLRIEEDPLKFYLHIDQIIAAGDLVLMQNDWTDNYQ